MSAPDLNEKASEHVRRAISELRGSKTAINKGRDWLPRCDADLELLLELRRLRESEVRLIAIARKLESTERYATQPEASP